MKKFITIMVVALLAMTCVFADFDRTKLAFNLGGGVQLGSTAYIPKGTDTVRYGAYTTDLFFKAGVEYEFPTVFTKADFGMHFFGKYALTEREFGNIFPYVYEEGEIDGISYDVTLGFGKKCAVKVFGKTIPVVATIGPTIAWSNKDDVKGGVAGEVLVRFELPKVGENPSTAHFDLGVKGAWYPFFKAEPLEYAVRFNTGLTGVASFGVSF